jgi:hypothetical protein
MADDEIPITKQGFSRPRDSPLPGIGFAIGYLNIRH